MIKRLLIIFLIAFGPQGFGGELNNSFEGSSSYIKGLKKVGLKIFNKKAPQKLKSELRELDLGEGLSCETNALERIEELFYRAEFKVSKLNLKRALLYLREENIIDDLVWKLLYTSVDAYALKFKSRLSTPRFDKDLRSKLNVDLFKTFSKSRDEGMCLSDAFVALVSKLKESKATKLKTASLLALKKEYISLYEYHQILELINSKYLDSSITLSELLNKVRFFDKQFPDRRPLEVSDFITSKKSKKSLSSRERIYTKFTKFQVVTMRELIEKLISRLNADRISINVHLDGQVIEVLDLDPLEQYRFSAKMIRKEIVDLEQRNLFLGQKVLYTDLLAASYETGLIGPSELKFLSEIEQLWSKDLSKTQRVVRFVRQYSSLFLVALPANLFYVRVLAMVGLESITDEDKDQSRDFSIF